MLWRKYTNGKLKGNGRNIQMVKKFSNADVG